MIRKDKLEDCSAEEVLHKTSSDTDSKCLVHDLEARALEAFSDKEDFIDK